MKHIHKIHFVGIGGIGMCGIAEVMLNQGYEVSGSDMVVNDNVQRLQGLGAYVYIGHSADNIKDADVLVISSAIHQDNPELIEAASRRIPVVPRAEMLSELMRTKYGIAVSGTHGKTTTTSMIASMLDEAALSPTYVIGGRLLHNDMNASLGSSEYFLAEADESDGSFLLFHPVLSVVTNIDNDHLDSYKYDMNELIESFKKFIIDIPFYGCAILCMDDEYTASLLPYIHRRVTTYGFHDQAALRCVSMQQDLNGVEMHIKSKQFNLDDVFRMRLFGRHNVLNALASICVGMEVGLTVDQIKTALANFRGIARRFNVYPATLRGDRSVSIIDDYGHHPVEMRSVLETVSDVFSGRRILFIFEPHRYSRTKLLFDAFVESMLRADYQLVLPIYAAGESDTLDISSAALCDSLRSMGARNAHSVADTDALFEVLDRVAEDGDVILFMGAGSIGKLVRQYVHRVSS